MPLRKVTILGVVRPIEKHRESLLRCTQQKDHLILYNAIAVIHVNTSDPPRRQLYWYHPRVVRHSVIGRSQWLPHGHGTLCRNMFGTRLLFPSSAEI